METGIEQTKVYEAHYPENLRRIFIINGIITGIKFCGINNSIVFMIFLGPLAPKLFTVIYNIMKPFLHQNTLDKLKIFGNNKEEWTAALLEEIEADNLPLYYGGTMVDPDGDPKCPSKVRFLKLILLTTPM
jgi:hypothetical protein